MIGASRDDSGLEEMGDVAAEDSPIRREGSRMGSESDWRASVLGHPR